MPTAIQVVRIETLAHKLTVISQIQFVSSTSIGTQSESWGGAEDLMATLLRSQKSSLLVHVFHDLAHPPRNDICDAKFLGCIHVYWSRNREIGEKLQ